MKVIYQCFKSVFFLILTFELLIGCSQASQSPYVYEDGLPRSTPEEQGVPSETIARFFQMVEEKGYDVHGLMMIRHGKVIAEHWWAPYAPQYQHALYSATKTFTSTAIGFAVQEGLLNVDDKVISFFPDLLPDTISPQLADLSVEHLLTMSVGHDASATYLNLDEDPVRWFLNLPFIHEPGTTFAYDITSSHMLSRIITKVSGVSLLEYLKPRLFDPLGIEDVIWEMDHTGHNMGNGGSHMKTSDLAKMGIFLINTGEWNGEQLINKAWIETATTPHILQHPELTAEEIENAANDASQGYGYQVWMGRHNSYRAIGGQNQLIMVIPEYDFILVCHSSFMDEAGFNSLVYDMLPSMSEKKLKADKSFDLNETIAGYEIKRPFEITSTSKITMHTRRYQLEKNAAGIQSVLFRFDASGNCHLTLITDNAIHNVPFGLDSWLYGMTDRTFLLGRGAYPGKMGVTPFYTAGMCTWTADNQLSAYYLSMFNPGSDETFRFTFEGDELKMEIVPSNRANMGPPSMVQPEQIDLILRGIEF